MIVAAAAHFVWQLLPGNREWDRPH